MSNALAETRQGGALAAGSQQNNRMAVADIISHVALVQEVMRAVMKPDVHYGAIPGTGEKLTLYKQGAEVLCMAFRVADSYQVEDLSTDDVVRYRVTCIGTHQVSGLVLGRGMGEASSGESKYKWRKAFDDEYDATPQNMRRITFGRFKTKQVRTETADLANTILKMANKRAKIAMTINVTACGDMFGQDLEDMDEALRDHLMRHGKDEHTQGGASAAHPALAEWPAEAFAAQAERWGKAVAAGIKTADDILALARSKGALTPAQEAQIRAFKKADAPDAHGVTDVQPKNEPTQPAATAGADDGWDQFTQGD